MATLLWHRGPWHIFEEENMATDMRQVLDSMENALRLRIQADTERRSADAAEKEIEFKEKLMRAAASKAELDGKASGRKGAEDAVRRDQLMIMMMAGL